ncbi:hypothetical protein IHC92_20825 [Photobacterium damselae subsp. damselae]|uniref:hypothetical protein n=1 Tax=Photobacterium damselae TaxID=38293 RepID=UPI001F441BF8|nr:hypothetical protein [Photobacterium damselae]UKA23399.1 hypothetical protein IHC92_20825 [Photobacterium damselae subsp. damselae]
MDTIIILFFGLFIPLYLTYLYVRAARKRSLHLTPLVLEFIAREDVPKHMKKLAYDAYMDSMNRKLPRQMVDSAFVIAQMPREDRDEVVDRAKLILNPSGVSPIIKEKLSEIVSISLGINSKLYRMLYIIHVTFILIKHGCSKSYKKEPIKSIKSLDREPMLYAEMQGKLA